MAVPYISVFTHQQLSLLKDHFVHELKTAEAGVPNSIAFIKNPLPTVPLVQTGETFQVMSIGGSVFKSSLVSKAQDRHIEIHSTLSGDLPVMNTKQVLCDVVTKALLPDVRVLAINFAYPLDPVLRNGYLDGYLLGGSKEHTFDGLIKEKVGKILEEYIYETTGRHIAITLANDTVCLVLSGLEKYDATRLVGGIVGTGTNFGFFLNEHSIVNLESGNFNKFAQTTTGKYIDHVSTNPGHHLFEKEVAGKYLYQHYNHIIKAHHLNYPALESTKELAELVTDDEECSVLAHSLFNRSASMIAATIAGMYEYRGKQALDIIMEGSLFWKYDHYEAIVKHHLHLFDIPNEDITFHYIKNSNIVGPAHLATYAIN